jgi:hypothetical protein
MQADNMLQFLPSGREPADLSRAELTDEVARLRGRCVVRARIRIFRCKNGAAPTWARASPADGLPTLQAIYRPRVAAGVVRAATA